MIKFCLLFILHFCFSTLLYASAAPLEGDTKSTAAPQQLRNVFLDELTIKESESSKPTITGNNAEHIFKMTSGRDDFEELISSGSRIFAAYPQHFTYTGAFIVEAVPFTENTSNAVYSVARTCKMMNTAINSPDSLNPDTTLATISALGFSYTQPAVYLSAHKTMLDLFFESSPELHANGILQLITFPTENDQDYAKKLALVTNLGKLYKSYGFTLLSGSDGQDLNKVEDEAPVNTQLWHLSFTD